MVFGWGFGGKKRCGSKPCASRLFRSSFFFVGCIVLSVLSLSDFGRRLCFPVSRLSVISVSCITFRLHSLSDFGRRPCFPGSRFSVIFVVCVTIMPLSLSDFGRRHGGVVIRFLVGFWFRFPFPSPDLFPFALLGVMGCFPFPVFLFPFPVFFSLSLSHLLSLFWF